MLTNSYTLKSCHFSHHSAIKLNSKKNSCSKIFIKCTMYNCKYKKEKEKKQEQEPQKIH